MGGGLGRAAGLRPGPREGPSAPRGVGRRRPANGKTIAYYESTPSIKGIGETSSTSCPSSGSRSRPRRSPYQRGGRPPVRGARRLRHHRRHVGLRLPRSLGQPSPELRTPRTSWPAVRTRPSYSNPEVDELLANSRTSSPTGRASGPGSYRGPGDHRRGLADIPVSNPVWPLATNTRVQGAEVGSLWYWGSLFKDIWVTE